MNTVIFIWGFIISYAMSILLMGKEDSPRQVFWRFVAHSIGYTLGWFIVKWFLF
jgi:uncharacterized membrane protein YbhN (UPF0104 family)